MATDSGRLVLVATPIGNLEDLSPRAAAALSSADFWLVEDTRVSARLQSHIGSRKPMKVLNEHTSEDQLRAYLREIRAGSSACLLTDGGTPAISDPGALLCDMCHDAGVLVQGVPGPSAPILALALSGFFAQRFVFLGFLPRKPGAVRGELAPYAGSPLTLVSFESPHRLESLLRAAGEALGERRYAVCREMTKAHEQVFRARLPYVPSEAEVPRKGEVTVVFEGLRRQR